MSKNLIKKCISVIVIMLLMMPLNVSAASYSVTDITSRLDQISSQSGYRPGDRRPANNCYKFVQGVSQSLFGVNIPCEMNGYFFNNLTNNWYRVDMIYDSNASDENVVKLLKSSQPGDIIQYRNSITTYRNSNTTIYSQHTAMIYDVNSSGITIYDSTKPYKTANFQKVRKYTCTWDSILGWSWESGMGRFNGTYGYGISLYRCVKSPTGATNIIEKPDTAGTFSVKEPSNVTENTARVNASYSYTGNHPLSVGLYIGTSENNMSFWKSDKINNNKNPLGVWYNLTGLSSGTTYYYKFYAETNAGITWSNVNSFKTVNPVQPVDSVSLTVKNPSNISEDTAKVSASCSYTGGRPSSVGLYIGA